MELDECPWKTVPDPLKEVVAQAFPSAGQAGVKTLDGGMTDESIELFLRSPHISGDIDRFGEVYQPGLGLGLQDFGQFRRGKWRVTGRPITWGVKEQGILGELDNTNVRDVMDRLLKLPDPGDRYLDPTPPQLQALAQFFHTNQDRFSVVQI